MTKARDLSQTPNASLGFKNRIINGDMRIDQRNAGGSITGEGFVVDRWRCWFNQSYSFQRVADAPPGFQFSIRVTKTSTTQSTYGLLAHYIEGFNVSDLNFGTSNATPIALSFWVKSSVTGNFTVAVYNGAEDRSYPASYTINSANTWEYKTITVPGDTTGTWLRDNGKGLNVFFNFGGGSGSQPANAWYGSGVLPASNANANLGTTNGATFQITGVQLEKGSTATSFDYRPYGTELNLCHRYFRRIGGELNGYAFVASGIQRSGTSCAFGVTCTPPMRATPTIGGSNMCVSDRFAFDEAVTGYTSFVGTPSGFEFWTTTANGVGAQYRPILLQSNNNSTGFFDMNAEL